MADRNEIEPYRRDYYNQQRYQYRDDRNYSRGSSLEQRRGYGGYQQDYSPSYNRGSQERLNNEDRKYEELGNPHSILKRRDYGYNRTSRDLSEDYRRSSHGRPPYQGESSRSPQRDQ